MSESSELAKTIMSRNSHDKSAVEAIKGGLEIADSERGNQPIRNVDKLNRLQLPEIC